MPKHDCIFLKNLYVRNSELINKSLFGMPAMGLVLVAIIIFDSSCCIMFVKAFLWLAITCFIISLNALSYSFFISEKAIDDLIECDEANSYKKNEYVKKTNKFVFYCTFFGYLCISIAVGIFTF